jgi:hypothetical protein
MQENYWKTTFGALEYDPDVFASAIAENADPEDS